MLIVFLNTSCEQPRKHVIIESNGFEFISPTIVNVNAKAEIIDTTNQLESITYPLLISDTTIANLNQIPEYRNYVITPNSIEFTRSNDVRLIVDSRQTFTGEYKERSIEPPMVIEIDQFGKEVLRRPRLPAYDSVTKIPVYLFNPTDSVQGIENHDGRLICIQEAQDEQGEWKPIEYFQFSGCGNSYGLDILPSNHYLLFGVNRYNGNFRTKIRVKLCTNGKLILSNEFIGTINKGQFHETVNNVYDYNKYLTFPY